MPSTPGNRVLRKENRADRLAEWETHSFSAASEVVPFPNLLRIEFFRGLWRRALPDPA
jgi:hypothetical protein